MGPLLVADVHNLSMVVEAVCQYLVPLLAPRRVLPRVRSGLRGKKPLKKLKQKVSTTKTSSAMMA